MQKVGNFIFTMPNEKMKTSRMVDTFRPNIQKKSAHGRNIKTHTAIKLQGIRKQIWD